VWNSAHVELLSQLFSAVTFSVHALVLVAVLQKCSFGFGFYRAMHFSAIQCKAQSCDRRSSVRLSVTFVDCDHIGCSSFEIISPLVSLVCSLFAGPNMTGLLQGERTPWNFGRKWPTPCWFERWETFNRKMQIATEWLQTAQRLQ